LHGEFFSSAEVIPSTYQSTNLFSHLQAVNCRDPQVTVCQGSTPEGSKGLTTQMRLGDKQRVGYGRGELCVNRLGVCAGQYDLQPGECLTEFLCEMESVPRTQIDIDQSANGSVHANSLYRIQRTFSRCHDLNVT